MPCEAAAFQICRNGQVSASGWCCSLALTAHCTILVASTCYVHIEARTSTAAKVCIVCSLSSFKSATHPLSRWLHGAELHAQPCSDMALHASGGWRSRSGVRASDTGETSGQPPYMGLATMSFFSFARGPMSMMWWPGKPSEQTASNVCTIAASSTMPLRLKHAHVMVPGIVFPHR